ncbi:E3 ubiquitin-protein ligase RNF4 isoform X1 [Fopius arisanus]|uniref:BRCA1 protein n=1 Tax=Fopius arisanus TaxID=64838 RepID=A0A0C9PKF7_9HYME|nr:PREDICTED: E3 ubiquitin-protein ligase RNF4-like isoform X1 [Fopius arisanus]XP_011312932.1 PREDICTED: E3 ubiquitin-protein ligase RNF4-like isoform X1 [Fopius arisanus]
MSTVPKRRRRNRTNSPSSQPVHYIDLTADSPMQLAGPIPGRASQWVEESCSEASNGDSHSSEVGLNIPFLDTIIIDSTDPSTVIREAPVPRRLGRPKRSPTSRTTTIVTEENSIIDLDNTISDEDANQLIPQINDSVESSPTVLTCPVCYEDLRASRKPMSTKCGHIFCEECLIATLATQKKCPKCKGSITRKTCHRIYF